ncbi:MAG: GH92 family glycosyl hydrolase [Bacteroidia bacterium]
MYKVLSKSIICLQIIFLAVKLNAQEEKFRLVNPFIGTGGHGHTFPGVVSPFGMVQLSPDTRIDGSWDGCGGYHYSDKTIHGFSHTHLSGTGVSDWGDILIMPSKTNKGTEGTNYSSTFSHNNESAHAGYYSVQMDNGVLAELTSTPRVGIHHYHYSSDTGFVYINLLHRDKTLKSNLQIIDSVTISGYRVSEAWAKEQYCYFTMKFDQPIVKINTNYSKDLINQNAYPSAALLKFKLGKEKNLKVKVALSSVDNKGSEKNLKAEAKHWNFTQYVKECESNWEEELNKIDISSFNIDDKKIFYTALYHCFIHPSLDMDVDNRYRGRDKQIHQATGYTHYNVFSLWDTYRALHPLFTLLQVERTIHFIKTFQNQYFEGKKLPVWELSSNETNCMIGYHSVSVIADAFLKGIKSFDTTALYLAMKNSATVKEYGIDKFYQKGFLEVNDESESVSKSLEYAYDNWCIAKMGKCFKDEENYDHLFKTSLAYKNLFDSKSGFVRPRYNGNWYYPFNPTEINNHFTEGNCWHYTFYVPHDIEGLIKLHGGENAFEDKLDLMFASSSKTSGRDQADVTGLIGQYAHGNEPSHHVPFLYHFIGKPMKTYQRVKTILSSFYSNKPDGLIGNDDCGQMSAWYVLASIGMYQVCPGDNQFEIFQPSFIQTKINFENGKQLEINAKSENQNVSHISINGNKKEQSFLSYKDLIEGGTINYYYSEVPNQNFGYSISNRPRSFVSEATLVPSPIIEYPVKSFETPITVTVSSISTNSTGIYYTLDGRDPNKHSAKYSKPIQIKSTSKLKVKQYNEKDSSSIIASNLFRKKSDFSISISNKINSQYQADGPASLLDGEYGDKDWRKGSWIGVQGENLECIIYSKSKRYLNSLSANFLQDTRSWIIYPKKITVYTSTDGKSYKLFGETENKIDAKDYEIQIQNLTIKGKKHASYKYIKLVAEYYGKLPEWHQGKGDQAFIFVDELNIR